MDWIKVLNRHVLFEYSDLRDSEFVAWIKIMALTAMLEKEPTREQMLKYVNYQTLDSLSSKLHKHSIDLSSVLHKVLIDVSSVSHMKENAKLKMQQYRARMKSVTGNVTVTLPRREDKIREDKIKEKKEKKIISDDEWLKGLEENPTYTGIEVRTLYGKMLTWCETNGKKPTRRRFVNWLNRQEKPLNAGTAPTQEKPKPTKRCQKCEELVYYLTDYRGMALCRKCLDNLTG